ncbi:MAG: hypothetical protein AAF556_09150, partial [Pseudomonadota bacterium]
DLGGETRLASFDHGGASFDQWRIPDPRRGMASPTKDYLGPFTPEGHAGEYILDPRPKPIYLGGMNIDRKNGPVDYDGKRLPPIDLDKAAVAETMGRIEGLTEQRIEGIIDRVPGQLMSDDMKQVAKDALAAAAPKVRAFTEGFIERFDKQYPNGWGPAADAESVSISGPAANGNDTGLGELDVAVWRAQNDAKRSLGADAGTGPSGPVPDRPSTRLG